MKKIFTYYLAFIVLISFSCRKEKKRLDNYEKEMHHATSSMMDNMHAVPMSMDNDIDFARMMIAHHQGAIDMVDVLMNYSKHSDMKSLASKIREGNVNSINRLNSFISSHGPILVSINHASFMAENNTAMSKMHETMMGTHHTLDPDYDFAQMMIHHHQGAIDMAKIEIKYGSDAGGKDEAQMILDQEKEIIELGQWLNSHGEPQKHRKN